MANINRKWTTSELITDKGEDDVEGQGRGESECKSYSECKGEIECKGESDCRGDTECKVENKYIWSKNYSIMDPCPSNKY